MVVALVAATSLHGLFFVVFQQQVHDVRVVSNHQFVQIELLPDILTESSEADLPITQQEKLASKLVYQVENADEIHVLHDALLSPQTLPIVHKTPKPKIETTNAISKSLKQGNPVEVLPKIQGGMATALIVPQDIQQQIFTHIAYPVRARRRGWEGQVEFQLDVMDHSIQQVTMLVSSGYALLDRAARKGLYSVQSLPLHDGRYYLPIAFLLQ